MSKTLKTRPLHVRILDPKDHTIGLAEHHNHTKGYCDLPERTIQALSEREEQMAKGEYPHRRKESCSYDFSYKGVGICSCLMCSDRIGRKKKARKVRHSIKNDLVKEKQAIQTALRKSDAVSEESLEEFDTPWIDPNGVY